LEGSASREAPVKKPYISSPFGWGLDGGSQRIYRATRTSEINMLRIKRESLGVNGLNRDGEMKHPRCPSSSTLANHRSSSKIVPP
jgi:hypothetical protein